MQNLQEDIREATGCLVTALKSIRADADIDAAERAELISESERQFKKHVADLVMTDIRKRRRIKPDETGRGRAPKGRDPEHFKAGGNGPATEKLWVAYDNNRRATPGMPQSAFARAWSSLTDIEKDQIRAEEAAAEAAREAAAAAEQKEREQQMDDVMIKGAHAVVRGEIENTVRRSTWHTELRKMAAERQEKAESTEQTLARLVKTDPDALALFRASIGGVADDVPPAPAAPTPVLKHGTAYASLRAIAAEMQKVDPTLTQYTAFAKAFHANPALAEASKREQAFG